MAKKRANYRTRFWQQIVWKGEATVTRLLVMLLQGRSHRTMRKGVRWARQLATPALGKRLATANSNLALVYGDQLTAKQRQSIAAKSLDSFFLSCLESIIQPIEPPLIDVDGEGLEDLFKAQVRGQGLIVGSLHLGCWDIGLRWLSQHLDNLVVVYRPARNPHSDAVLNAARRSNSNCQWVSQSDTKKILLCIKNGGSLVMMTDLYTRSSSAPQADFLGLNTRVAKGPLALSQRAGCPLFPVAHVRTDNDRFHFSCGKPLIPTDSSSDLSDRANALSLWQETWINTYTEQYYWINRRWRSNDGSGQRLRPSGPVAERALRRA
ncbi:lysophospholipid acyltransferase family protein [Cyanobium sp. HWJ4-Hawea]|uniref:lysophospholipid acyltransferase family protein n=1 Tax=Cyanobium sp. HWJ4-Hawea TaxID=2823713 RepID=UPI0020CE3AC3|nr:lysophospholipid acyltransferase family protein [Cyanobium sp. HWJ4-Hawea]MCP9809813.1 lysophospholipid acyltransferase family protein [Cyanobium sp. HWJ4-Hawea]